jgi:hypothetical protein
LTKPLTESIFYVVSFSLAIRAKKGEPGATGAKYRDRVEGGLRPHKLPLLPILPFQYMVYSSYLRERMILTDAERKQYEITIQFACIMLAAAVYI